LKPFEKLESAEAPDGTVLTLYRHDGDYYIRAGTLELMSTRRHQSEDRLGELACAPYRDVPDARVLIGGLGLGFTLASSLKTLASDARVIVAELLPEVIAWFKNPAYALGGARLDPRVELKAADVLHVMRDSPSSFDAIILDTDNGAESFTTSGNARLYDDDGIGVTKAALRPNGRIAYWLADEDRGFARALRRAGLHVDVVQERVHATSRGHHTLIVAQLR
jgi:spermidine synthase